jgi:hypothetical protein
MRRPLALLAALATLGPLAARAEPLDFEVVRLGAPTAAAWEAAGAPAAQAQQLADEARIRFARLTAELALAFTAPLLTPASTTGMSGFEFDVESSYVQVHPTVTGPGTPFYGARDQWATRSMRPHELYLPGFHVRKALPFSLELGARGMYLSQSSIFGGQLELKWALNEGFDVLPDVGVRLAYTQVFGQRDLNLHATDADFLVSKRFGVNAVVSLTPYAAARFSLAAASTPQMSFVAAPADNAAALAGQAEFPTLSRLFFRTTVGVRMTSFATSLAAEVTYYGGGRFKAPSTPSSRDYPTYSVESSWTGAFKFGFEF